MTNTEAPKFLEPESPDRVSCYYWIFVDNNGELHLEDLRRTLINGQEPKTNPQQTSEIRMHSFPVNQEGNGKYVLVRDLWDLKLNLQVEIMLAIHNHYKLYPPKFGSKVKAKELIRMLFLNFPGKSFEDNQG